MLQKFAQTCSIISITFYRCSQSRHVAWWCELKHACKSTNNSHMPPIFSCTVFFGNTESFSSIYFYFTCVDSLIKTIKISELHTTQ